MDIEKVEKLVTNLNDKIEDVIQIRNLKQTLNHGLVLKKVHTMIQLNQKPWLKPYIDMNTKLKQKAKTNFEKDFFKQMNKAVFGKTMKNMRKHRNIKLVTTESRRNQLVLEPSYHTPKLFTENFVVIETGKSPTLMNKSIYFSLSILILSNTVMYEFQYDYVKPKYGQNAQLCYMNTDSFIVNVKIGNIYKSITEIVETRFSTSNCPKEKIKK